MTRAVLFEFQDFWVDGYAGGRIVFIPAFSSLYSLEECILRSTIIVSLAPRIRFSLFSHFMQCWNSFIYGAIMNAAGARFRGWISLTYMPHLRFAMRCRHDHFATSYDWLNRFLLKMRHFVILDFSIWYSYCYFYSDNTIERGNFPIGTFDSYYEWAVTGFTLIF